MFERLNKRRLHLLWKLIANTRLNADLGRYLLNRIRTLCLNRNHSTTIAHPTNGMIELGNQCNLHCIMCPREFQYGKEMDKGYMPLERAKQIIDEMYPYLDSIGLTGLGETLLYPHLLELVRYIKQKKKSIIITISTNAHLKNYRERITPILPYIDNIQFSVDGGCAETYDAIRPKTSFEEITQNIRYTINEGNDVTFMINCVVMRENCHDMKKVILLAQELGVRYVNFNCVSIASDPGRDRTFYDFFQSAEFQSCVKEVEAMREQFSEMEITGPVFPVNGEFRDCIFPWEYPYITWDGYYVPCCGKPFPKLLHFGNVFEKGVMNVLNSPEAQAFRRMWQKNTPPSFCHNCQLTRN
jgi:MoaA/NifB/PqqE/SkfB family radical SAM enzyme